MKSEKVPADDDTQNEQAVEEGNQNGISEEKESIDAINGDTHTNEENDTMEAEKITELVACMKEIQLGSKDDLVLRVKNLALDEDGSSRSSKTSSQVSDGTTSSESCEADDEADASADSDETTLKKEEAPQKKLPPGISSGTKLNARQPTGGICTDPTYSINLLPEVEEIGCKFIRPSHAYQFREREQVENDCQWFGDFVPGDFSALQSLQMELMVPITTLEVTQEDPSRSPQSSGYHSSSENYHPMTPLSQCSFPPSPFSDQSMASPQSDYGITPTIVADETATPPNTTTLNLIPALSDFDSTATSSRELAELQPIPSPLSDKEQSDLELCLDFIRQQPEMQELYQVAPPPPSQGKKSVKRKPSQSVVKQIEQSYLKILPKQDNMVPAQQGVCSDICLL